MISQNILFYHRYVADPWIFHIFELKRSKYSKYLSLYEKLKLVRLITRFSLSNLLFTVFY